MESINILYSEKQELLKLQEKVSSYPKNQVLIQVFSGTAKKDILLRIQSELIETFPGIPIIGATTDGEIIGSQVTERQIVISIALFEKTKVTTCYVDDKESPDGSLMGSKIKQRAPNVAILFSTGTVEGTFRNNAQYIETIHQMAPDVILAGGQAGIDRQCMNTYVFTENIVSNHGSVAATLRGKHLNVWTYRNDGWKSIGRHMKITQVEGSIVKTIDNISVKDIYQHYLGIKVDIASLSNPTLEFPLTYTRNNVLLKNVPIKEFPDGSVEFLRPFKQDESVRFSFCDILLLEIDAQKIKDKLKAKKPEAIFIYSCSVRKHIFGKDISVDSKHLDDIASSAGFFTSTEFFTVKNRHAHCLIQNMTILALSEKQHQETATDIVYSEPVYDDNTQRSVKTLKILTNLIAVTSDELELSNKKLAEMATKDNMTGLYNRRYFDKKLPQEIKRHSRADIPLSLIMLDVDFFKQFNDVYGHVAGDNCLAAIGKVLNTTLKRPADIAFRYGGEEMGCLLPSTDYLGAKNIAEQIRANIEKEAIPHQKSTVSENVTASIGFITYWFSKDTIPNQEMVIETCDKMLYQAKKNGRNQIVGREVT